MARYFDEETQQWLDAPERGPDGPLTAPRPPSAPVTYNAPQVMGQNVYNPNGDFVNGNANPRETMPDYTQPGYKPPAPPAPETKNSWDGLTGRALVNNKDYATYRLNEAWKKQYGTDMPADKLNYFLKAALTPDTFTGGERRQGISDYWIDRAVNPASAGGSTADRGGADTYLGMDNSPGPGGGMKTSGGGGFKIPSVSSLMAGLAGPLKQWDQAPELDNQAIQDMMTQPSTSTAPEGFATSPAAAPPTSAAPPTTTTLPPNVLAALEALNPEDRSILMGLMNRG